MKWTWEQVKVAALQKMFAAEGNVIPNDDSVKDYVASMPQACNEALSIISRVGRYIYKTVGISHNPIPNLITGSRDKQLLTYEYSEEIDDAKSYYFQYSGTGTLEIYEDGTLVETLALDSENFKEARGFISDGVKRTKFVFTPTYPLTITNLAFYPVSFASEDKIPAYMDCVKYDLSALVPDFHTLENVYYDGMNAKYMQTSIYNLEGDHTLVLRADKPGNYTVYYRSFPNMVTNQTLDTYEFDLPDDFMLLIPMYIASELYKEDDLAIATSYRNQFEVEIKRLSDEAAQAPSSEKFESKGGWI